MIRKNIHNIPVVIFILTAACLSGCGGPAGKLATEPGPGSLVMDAEGHYLYVACEGSRAVQAWELKRRRVVARCQIGAGPVRLLFTKPGGELVALCQGGRQAWFLKTPGLQKTRVQDLPDGPAGWAGDSQTRRDFFCSPDGNLVRPFINHQPLDPVESGSRPSDLFLQPDTDKLWVANYKSHDLAIISPEQGKILKRIPVRSNPVKFLPARGQERLFVFCTGQDALPAQAVLQGVDLVYQTAALTYTLGAGIRDCALDASGRRCFCLAPGRLLVKDLDSGRERKIKTVPDAGHLAVSPDGQWVYVSSPQSVYVYKVK